MSTPAPTRTIAEESSRPQFVSSATTRRAVGLEVRLITRVELQVPANDLRLGSAAPRPSADAWTKEADMFTLVDEVL